MIEKLAGFCDRVLSLIVLVFSVFMVLIAGAQIVCRELLDMPLSWSEEMATYLFIWWVYLGATLAVRGRNHLGIDIFIKYFNPRLAVVNMVVMHLGMLLFAGFMFYFGIVLMKQTMADLTPITQIPFGLLFLIQPACALCMVIFIVEILIKRKHETPPVGE